MDLDNVETIDVNAKGGADTITVNDLTGTDVNKVNIDLGQTGGGGDGAVDTIVINATKGDDTITVTNNNGVITVSGLPETVTTSNFEANDRLVINGVGGNDVIAASGLSGMQLTANGGGGGPVLAGRDRQPAHDERRLGQCAHARASLPGCLWVKTVGEPDALIGHVRFVE